MPDNKQDDDATEYERDLVPSGDTPKEPNTYEKLYADALNGDEEALTDWGILYLQNQSRSSEDVSRQVSALSAKLDDIIASKTDPQRLNACFMRAILYLEVSSIHSPPPPVMNELLDEIIKSKCSDFLKEKALYYRAENYSEGNGCDKNLKMALKYYELSAKFSKLVLSSARIALNISGTDIRNEILEEDCKKIEAALVSFSDSIGFLYLGQQPIEPLEADEKAKLEAEVTKFLNEARAAVQANVEACKSEQNPMPAEDFLEKTGKKIAKLANNNFSHRHKGRRILLDVFFIPLGIALLGAPLLAKKHFTGSFTFYGAATYREHKLKQVLPKDEEKDASPPSNKSKK